MQNFFRRRSTSLEFTPLGFDSYTACVKQKDLLQTNDKIALGLGLGLGVPTFIAALWQMARWYLGRDHSGDQSKKMPDVEID